MHMYLLKISNSSIFLSAYEPTVQTTLTDPDQILQACVGRSQISRVKICAPWAKGAQTAGQKGGSFFVTSTMNSHFFVTGQISMKFGGNVNRCPNWTLIEEFWKFTLKGWFCPKPPFLVALTVLHVTCLQVRGYVSRLIKAFRLLQEGPTVCPPWIDFLCDLPFRLQKPLNLPKFR